MPNRDLTKDSYDRSKALCELLLSLARLPNVSQPLLPRRDGGVQGFLRLLAVGLNLEVARGCCDTATSSVGS